MGAHQAMTDHVGTSDAIEREHQLNLRLLRFRNRPDQEEPALLALELAAVGRTHDAIEIVDAALARDPDDLDVLLGCGLAAVRSGRLAFAQLVLTRAASHDPSWTAPLRELAKVFAMRGRHDKAIEVARRAIEAGDGDAELAAMVRREDRRLALDARLAIFRERDGGAEDPALLAQELLSEERLDDAIEVARAGLAREDDADLAMVEARARIAGKDRDAAEAALARAIAMAPTWGEPARVLAEMLADRGALIDAAVILERAIAAGAADPSLPPALATVDASLRAAGIERRPDVALDALLGTLDRIDPIGDETRRAFARSDTLVDGDSPIALEKRRRTGWLPRIAKSLFGGARVVEPVSARVIARA